MSEEPAEPLPQEPAPPVEERRYPSTIGGACYLVVLAASAVGLVITLVGDWRVGVKVFAAALAAAALLRLLLRQRDAGMLAVRHRAIDVAMLGGVAVVLYLLAASIPNQPL